MNINLDYQSVSGNLKNRQRKVDSVEIIKNTNYSRRKRRREILVSLLQRGCRVCKFVNFVTRILCVAFYNEFIKRIIKGDFVKKSFI